MVLKVSFACWDYDRMKAIEDGRVRVEGLDLNFLNLRVEETCVATLRIANSPSVIVCQKLIKIRVW
jgi:4,5-dihydroxyphthalate decarboxylase